VCECLIASKPCVLVTTDGNHTLKGAIRSMSCTHTEIYLRKFIGRHHHLSPWNGRGTPAACLFTTAAAAITAAAAAAAATAATTARIATSTLAAAATAATAAIATAGLASPGATPAPAPSAAPAADRLGICSLGSE